MFINHLFKAGTREYMDITASLYRRTNNGRQDNYREAGHIDTYIYEKTDIQNSVFFLTGQIWER